MGGKQRKIKSVVFTPGGSGVVECTFTGAGHAISGEPFTIPLGDTCAHYTADIAQMEGLSRAVGAVSADGVRRKHAVQREVPFTAIKLGTDPQSSGYWGETARTISVSWRWRPTVWTGLLLKGDKLTARLPVAEVMNLHAWLNQITDAQMPDSNWNYFCHCGSARLWARRPTPYDQDAIDHRFALMDAFTTSATAGIPTVPAASKDYHRFHGHFYGPIYATPSDDEARAKSCASALRPSRKTLSTGPPPMAPRCRLAAA